MRKGVKALFNNLNVFFGVISLFSFIYYTNKNLLFLFYLILTLIHGIFYKNYYNETLNLFNFFDFYY